MTTIDELLHHMDKVKCRYDKEKLMDYLFEFSYQFAEYCNLPKSQLTFEAVISWKLAGIVRYVENNYQKHERMAYQNIKIPPLRTIPPTLEYERKNWIEYWKRMTKQLQ